jgi:serine protease
VTVGTPTGGGISLSGSGYKVQGRLRVDLSWADATGSQVEIRRDGALIATTANDGFYTDDTGLKGSGSLTYQACETGGGGCSATITIIY